MKFKLIAVILCFAMLAGCSSTQSPQSEGTSSDSSTTVSQVESQMLQRDYEAEELNHLLNSINNTEAGSAGSTMKAAAVAADFVRFSVQYANADNETFMLDDIKNWYVRLSEEEREMIGENWPLVYGSAKDLVRNPEDTIPLLADAGVEIDFLSMDLTNGLVIAERVEHIINE